MQIACEKCGAEYTVDERFLPAGGTAVQCTRCRHTFTAKPPERPVDAPSGFPPAQESPSEAASVEAPGEPPFAPAPAPAAAATVVAPRPVAAPPPPAPMRPRMVGLALGSGDSDEDEADADDGAPDEPVVESAGWIWAVLAIALLAACWVGYGEWARRRAMVPPALKTQLLAARTLLRADAAQSVAQAAEQFQALSTAMPTWREPRTWLAVARALQLDDARAELKVTQDAMGRAQRQVADLEADRESTDAQSQANALRVELQRLATRAGALRQALSDAEGQLAQVAEALPPVKAQSLEEQVAQARMEMLLTGVHGTDPRGLVEQYRQLGGGEGWDVLALEEYVANGGGMEGWKRVLPEVKRLRETDASFIRVHVLAGRCAALAADRDLALSALEAALALNSEHGLARLLKEDVAARPAPP